MGWIWNDVNFLSRISEDTRIKLKVELPIFVFILFIVFIFLERLTIYEVILISFAISFFINSILGFIFQFPHWKIPEHSSQQVKRLMYFFDIIFASLFLYIFCIGILQHYYPFFEKLVCCNIIKNFNLAF